MAVALVLVAGLGGLYAVDVQLDNTDTSGEVGQLVENVATSIGLPVQLLFVVVFGIAAVAFVVGLVGVLVSQGGMTSGGGR